MFLPFLFIRYCTLCGVLLIPVQPILAQGGTLIILNKSDATASLLDRRTGKEVAKIPTGTGPHEVAVSPDGRTAVVCNYGSRTPGSTLTIIDLPDRKVRKTIDLGKYHRPHGIEFLPRSGHVVVTAEQQKVLLIIDIASGKVLHAIDTGQQISHMVAVTPNADRAFVANIGSGSVCVIDLDKARRVKVIPTDAGAEGLDISPDGREVWVANRGANNLSIIGAQELKVIQTVDCPAFPIRVKFAPDGRHVLVSNAKTGDVAVFDAKSRKEIHRIPMKVRAVEIKENRLFGDRFGESPVPVGIVISPDGRHAYVANTNADLITVIDLKEWRITRRLKAGREPDGMAYSPIELKSAG